MIVLHCISSFEGTSYKKLQDIATIYFYFLLFYIRICHFLQIFETWFKIF